MAALSPDELFDYGWRLADEALASGEWQPPTDEQLDRVAALVGPDLRRMRAGSRNPNPSTPGRAA